MNKEKESVKIEYYIDVFSLIFNSMRDSYMYIDIDIMSSTMYIVPERTNCLDYEF